jgi:hypothetical protein
MFKDHRRAGPGTRRRLVLITAVVAGLALVPASAGAQGDPTDAQYGSTLDQISQGSGGSGEQSANDQSTVPGGVQSTDDSDRVVGGLPFTGLDVGLLALVALGLGTAGLVLYRRSRGASSSIG